MFLLIAIIYVTSCDYFFLNLTQKFSEVGIRVLAVNRRNNVFKATKMGTIIDVL